MIRLIALLMLLAAPSAAQDFSALARVDPARSQVVDDGSNLVVTLALSQPIPYRVYTLDQPRRLVVDFREADWSAVSRDGLLNADLASDLRFGLLQPGWSRLVVDLAQPLILRTAELSTQESGAVLRIRLDPATEAAFAARAGAPPSPWDTTPTPEVSLPAPTPDDGVLTVVIDPGHGGVDPGALRGDIVEADLMLTLGIELAEALNRTGAVRAILTRTDDRFVSLDGRMTAARAAGADLFLSLHADALEEDEATGASVYTLNAEGADRAARRLAERHERGDLLAGLDLTDQDDRVAGVLMDLAMVETAPRAIRFADTLVDALRQSGARLNSKPRREARLAVLSAADFPSVLIEAGFLSSAADRATLTSAEGRARLVAGIAQGVLDWAAEDAALAPLMRQ